MTQEVQPLTWQKRTNLEEHQQFFSKINEIIGNLAPTVDEAEQSIAQATAAIASANDAVATANAASAAASAAASQAQTAASTVAGYDSRLTAAEGDITALQGRMGTAEGSIASLGDRMTAAESKNTQQDTAIAALQTADGQNVKISRINEYAVGLTGNQENIVGTKGFVGEIRRIVNGNYLRGLLTKLNMWKIGEAVKEQVTYWPIAVSDTGITDFPFLIVMSETADGRDILGFECKGQNGLTFGLRIVCTAQEVGLYLLSGSTVQNVARITR